jgi:hypothetical protein
MPWLLRVRKESSVGARRSRRWRIRKSRGPFELEDWPHTPTETPLGVLGCAHDHRLAAPHYVKGKGVALEPMLT